MQKNEMDEGDSASPLFALHQCVSFSAFECVSSVLEVCPVCF